MRDAIFVAPMAKTTSLRRAGGSVTVVVPPTYLKETGLTVGSTVELSVTGDRLTIRPAGRKLTLKDILDATPADARNQRAPGWDEMTPVGRER
jgi:antitoxin component of MazEF toxin-antitoxin module